MAIGEKFPLDLRLALRRRSGSDGFFVGLDGHGTVGDAFEVIVGEIGTGGGEDCLQAQRPCWAGS